MKTQIFKAKNAFNEYTGQLDRGSSQIIVFADSSKERDRLVKEAKKILSKPLK